MSEEPVEASATPMEVEDVVHHQMTSDPADPTPDNNSVDASTTSSTKSALQDNIERKGKNAYYFAHAHRATGPAWDGKPEPKLLSRQESSSIVAGHPVKSSFEYHRSNITKYAFLDEPTQVKLYIEMEGVGEVCSPNDVCLDYTETSFGLVVQNYKEREPQCLSFGKLTGAITTASFRLKKDRIIVTLTKAQEGEWHTVNDKGTPDHDLV